MEKEVQLLIRQVEQADSADKLLNAVKALAKVRDEAVVPTLIDVLGFNNPGAAVAAVDALIEIGEGAVPHILAKLDGYNYGARAWATRALAGIGDPRAIELLSEAAVSDFSLSVRRAAARGLGNIIWSKLPPDEVETTQKRVLETLLKVAQDGEWVVRYAAVVGLESLALSLADSNRKIIEPIKTTLEKMVNSDTELAVLGRATMALLKML